PSARAPSSRPSPDCTRIWSPEPGSSAPWPSLRVRPSASRWPLGGCPRRSVAFAPSKTACRNSSNGWAEAPPLRGTATMGDRIHPSAVVDPRASVADDVSVGAFSVIGPEVTLGPGVSVGHHVVLESHVVVEAQAAIGHGSVIGGAPQDLKFS